MKPKRPAKKVKRVVLEVGRISLTQSPTHSIQERFSLIGLWDEGATATRKILHNAKKLYNENAKIRLVAEIIE